MAKVRKWRKEHVKSAKGITWRLATGNSRTGRTRLVLGQITEEVAERCVVAINKEEERWHGTQFEDRLLGLHQRDRDELVKYLLDEDLDSLFEPEDSEPNYSRMTLREYHDAVYAEWREVEVPRSWRTEEGHWRTILAAIGDVRIGDLDEFVVADYLDQLVVSRGKRKGEPQSGASKRLHRAALQAMVKRAYRLKHVDTLPDLALFRIKNSTKPVMEMSDPLDLDELLALMDASKPKHRAMWAVGAGQGLRPSELMTIRWEGIDWERKVMDPSGTKTEMSSDLIPVTPLAYRELRVWWEESGQPSEGIVFPGRGGQPYESESGYKGALRTAARRAGIERKVYPYLLRHSFATIAWCIGIEESVAVRIMRHSDEAMFRRVYCRPRPTDLVEKVSKFDF